MKQIDFKNAVKILKKYNVYDISDLYNDFYTQKGYAAFDIQNDNCLYVYISYNKPDVDFMINSNSNSYRLVTKKGYFLETSEDYFEITKDEYKLLDKFWLFIDDRYKLGIESYSDEFDIFDSYFLKQSLSVSLPEKNIKQEKRVKI